MCKAWLGGAKGCKVSCQGVAIGHLFIIIRHAMSSFHHHPGMARHLIFICVCHPCQGLPSLPRHPGTKEDLGGHYLGGVGRRERGGNVSDFDGSAMPSRLVGISKVAAYCLQLGTEMHSDRSNYILHIEVIPGHWGLVFTLSPKTSLALFSQQMLLCALDVSICKYFPEAISSSESLLAKGCLLS